MRVFVCHSSKDKPAVEKLAQALRDRGIDAWLDKWEIGPGDDIVAKINEGLEETQAGLIVFSAHTIESGWIKAETSYLTYARIQEGKALIPVILGDGVHIPPLLRPLARRGIEEIEAIADALLNRRAGPPPVGSPAEGRCERVLVTLRREGASGLRVGVKFGDAEHQSVPFRALPPAVAQGRAAFLGGFRPGSRGAAEAAAAARTSREAELVDLGRALGELCLPGDAGEALASLVDGCGVGALIEVCFEADDPELLGLPFEALRLRDGRLLATLPPVVMFRRPLGLEAKPRPPLPGPLKVLVAVGAPDEGKTRSVVLDHERELQTMLDSVEEFRRHENIEVRVLEVGHPEVIGKAIERDAYHVLHLSCHGERGSLELEDEEGNSVPTTAEELLKPIRGVGRPLSLVFLNACHGGVDNKQTASFAEALLRAGVPCVLAMQTSVSDYYATALAGKFYGHLLLREPPLAGRALAAARKDLEGTRLAADPAKTRPEEIQPEYATATLFVADEEPRLADFSLDKEPLRERPEHEGAGSVPQLNVGDLVGRRRELRETLRVLRDTTRPYAGVVLTGIGGVGKSALAGRVMWRLKESGFRPADHKGPFDLAAVAKSVGRCLLESGRTETRRRAERMVSEELDDELRLEFLAGMLTEEPVLLVLDDFEQNLLTGGGAFRDPSVGAYLGHLVDSARRGRLLITSRYPIPGFDDRLRNIALNSLTGAQTRKLLLRLPELGRWDRDPKETAKIIDRIGGHPRLLEFLDALLRGREQKPHPEGKDHLARLTEKLNKFLEKEGIDLRADPMSFDEGMWQVVQLGARDVLLEELAGMARQEGIDDALFQVAVSNLPVSPAGLAHMLADGPAEAAAEKRVAEALTRLAELSLVYVSPQDGHARVHRWTAEGFVDLTTPAAQADRYRRAGRYRLWRVEHETHDLEDAIEAARNFLAGGDFDAAVGVAGLCIDLFRRFRHTAGIAALAAEVLELLPSRHPAYPAIADEEADAHLALGQIGRALERRLEVQALLLARVQAEPDRADHQRDLSVSYERMGDLYRALGQGEQARESYQKALAIAERLAQAEPDRADYQCDLSVSYNKMGDLYRALGQGEQARESYLKDLAIAERLAQAEPDRADYQRDLSVSYERMGDLYRALGQGEQARESYQKDLAIAERLAQAEPDRADYQRDLSVSYERMGDLYSALGQGEQARESYQKALAIAERLAQAEPDRADYQRDLSVSY